MRCPNCKKSIDVNWKFCKNCGHTLQEISSENIEVKKPTKEGEYIWGYIISNEGRYQSYKSITKRLFRRDYKKVDQSLWNSGILNGATSISGEKAALICFQLGNRVVILGNDRGMKSARWRYLTRKKYPNLAKTKIYFSDIDHNIVTLISKLEIPKGTKFDGAIGDTLPQSWIDESEALLKKTLPAVVQNRVFLPESESNTSIYAVYFSHPKDQKTKALHIMAAMLFDWLHIDPKQCVIDFYDESIIRQHSSADMAGFYTRTKEGEKEQEVILINAKYRDDGLQVAAILAHEMMHLYLHRLKLELVDTRENELLTDLATIRSGLSVLVLNGMKYSNKWWLSVILLMLGRIYWSEQRQAFGYFKPSQYGKLTSNYIKGLHIPISDVYGYINPYARHFFPHRLFQKSSKKSWAVKHLLKRKIRVLILQCILVAAVVGGVIWIDSKDSSTSLSPQKTQLGTQIETCKAKIKTMEDGYSADQSKLDGMKSDMDQYEASGQVEEYNALVLPYNALLTKVKSEYTAYESQLAACNKLVEQYNGSR